MDALRNECHLGEIGMTEHKYYKRGVTTAEQFDGSYDMINKYDILTASTTVNGYLLEPSYAAIKTLEGRLQLHVGDWIATGVNGERWPIADDIFHKTYTPLPVLPQSAGNLIKAQKGYHLPLSNVLGQVQALGITRTVSNSETLRWISDHEDDFVLAWVLGEWDVADE